MRDLSNPQVAGVALACLHGHSRRQKHQWLSAWGSAEAVWAGPLAIHGTDPQLLTLLDDIDRWLEQATTAVPRAVLPLGDPRYPKLLQQAPDAPLALFVEGQLSALQLAALSVVGSRHASAQGLDLAHAFGHALASAALCVVSGLARGIDAAAHEGALTAHGWTVAVLGHGPDSLYPAAHLGLADRIKQQGCLVTEYPPGVPPKPARFPERNRIIAGLSLGTLVIEAGLPSGSLGTARLALDFGREVMAVPGSVMSPHARGCHALIKQGAALVECVDDVLASLNLHRPEAAMATKADARTSASAPLKPQKRAPRQPTVTASPHTQPATDGPGLEHAHAPLTTSPSDQEQAALLDALGWQPTRLETAATHAGLPPDRAQALLLDLELSGQVARLPGAWLQRRH